MADGSLLFNTKLNTTGFTKGLSKMQGLAKTGLNGIGKAAGAAMNLTKQSFKIGALALAGFGAYAIKAGSDFDAAMSEVGAISGATGEDMEALRTKAKEMGATTKFSASESAEALKYMAMAGWDTQKMLSGLPGIMNLAAASGESLGLVSDIVTDAMTAFGLEAGKAGEFADVLAMASSRSNTNVGLLGESFKYVAPLAGALGYSAEDTAVALGLMANAGIKGSQAGTTLKTSLANLAKPSKQMKTYMDKLGISMTDSKGQMKPLDQLLREMRGSFAGLSEQQKAQAASAIFGKESMAGMLAVLNASDEEFDSLTDSINNATGAADTMAKAMNDNLKGDIVLFKSALEGVGIALYEGVDNPARNVVQAFTGYMGQLQKAIDGPSKKVNDFIKRTGMTADEAGVVLEENKSLIERIGGTLGGILGDMASKLASAAPEVVKGARALIKSLFQGLSENSGDIAKAATEILAGLIDTFYTYAGEFLSLGMNILLDVAMGMAEKAPELVGTMVDAVSKVATAVFEAMPLLLEAGGQIVLNLVAGISKAYPQILTVLLDMANLIVVTLIDIAPELIKTGFELISNLAKGIAQYIPELMTSIATLIPTILNALIEGIPQLFEAGLVILKAIVDGIILSLPLLIEAIPQLITALYTALTEALPTLLEAGLQILTALLNGILENLPLLIQAAITILTGLVTFIMENLPVLIQAAIDILTAIVNGIVENLPLIIDAIIQLIDSIVLTVTENLPLLIEMAIEMIVTIMQALIDNLDKIIAATVLLIDALIAAVVENLPAIIEATIKIIITIAEALVNNLDKLIPPMIDLINTLVDAIIERLDLIIDAAIKIIQAVVKGLIDNLPKIIEATLKLVRAITKEIIARLPELVQSGLKIISEVARGIVENLPKVFEATGKLVGKIVETAISLLPDILATGAAFVAELVSGLLGALGSLVSTADDLANAAVEAIGKGFAGAFNIGKNLVEGIWNGIGSVKNWVLDKISGFAGGIMDGIKGFFGIKSPSRRMRDEVGKQLPPGVGVGFKAAMPDLIKTADDEMDKLEKHIKAGIDLDQTFQAEGSKQAVKQIAQYDYVISDDGKKMALSGDIHSTINIDGRPVAKAITPYVSEEQSLGRKRRM